MSEKPSRVEFRRWAILKGLDISQDGREYIDKCTLMAWMAWQESPRERMRPTMRERIIDALSEGGKTRNHLRDALNSEYALDVLLPLMVKERILFISGWEKTVALPAAIYSVGNKESVPRPIKPDKRKRKPRQKTEPQKRQGTHVNWLGVL